MSLSSVATLSATPSESPVKIFTLTPRPRATLIDSAATTWGGVDGVSLWYRVAPATGTHDIVVSYSGSRNYVAAGGTSYTNVHQSTPLGSSNKANAASGTAISVVVASAAGELVVDGAVAGGMRLELSAHGVRWPQPAGDRSAAAAAVPSIATRKTPTRCRRFRAARRNRARSRESRSVKTPAR